MKKEKWNYQKGWNQRLTWMYYLPFYFRDFPSFVNISLYLFKTSKVAAVILLCYMTLQCKQNKMFLIIPISHRRQLQPPNLPIFISIDIKSLVLSQISNIYRIVCDNLLLFTYHAIRIFQMFIVQHSFN